MNLTELILDENIDRVLVLDTGFKVIAWNKACELATGIKKDAIIGKNLFDYFPELQKDVNISAALTAALDGRKSFVPAGGQGRHSKYAENHFIPLKDASGQVIGILNVTHDVAHRINTESELTVLNSDMRRYQKEIESLNTELTIRNRQLLSLNSELKTFTNIAIHDYSETLRQLYLHFEYIVTNEAAKLSNTGRANIRKAQAAAQKMKLLTDDIIAYMRLNEFGSELQRIDLNELTRTVTEDLKPVMENAKVCLSIGRLPEIMGYPFLVSLVFYHLIENAIKFRKDNITPVIQISFEHVVKGKNLGFAVTDTSKEYYVITVTDNGIGFDGDKIDAIFQIFSRLGPDKYKGAGIGLAICKKAMEIHHGHITANSKNGQGSSFHCYFPVV